MCALRVKDLGLLFAGAGESLKVLEQGNNRIFSLPQEINLAVAYKVILRVQGQEWRLEARASGEELGLSLGTGQQEPGVKQWSRRNGKLETH